MIKAYIAKSFIQKHWKKILALVGGIFIFPFFIVTIFLTGHSLPMIDSDKMELYKQVAEDVGRDKTYINFCDLVGIDAVRYKQDFTLANRSNITELAKMFIKQEKETVTKDLTNYKTVTEKVHKDIDFREVVRLDSVLYGEDLNIDNKKHIEQLAKKFVKVQKRKVTDKDGKVTYVEVKTIRSLTDVLISEGKSINQIPFKFKDKNKITVKMQETAIVYVTKSIEEVCKELGFTKEEIEQAKFYANQGIAILVGDVAVQEFTGSQQDFINAILPGALENYKKYKVFPSIIMSQAILESGWGKSGLSKKANNLFGIKAYNWNGPYVTMGTTEYRGGVPYKTTANFRKYSSFSDSVLDHGKFLSENQRYANHGLFNAKSYVEQAYALRSAGYATDPNYPNLLFQIIKTYNLQQYDNPSFSLDNPMSGVQYLDGGVKLPYYLQTDRAWANKPYGNSTVGVSGCGVTSLSMVVSGLTNRNITPPQMATFATQAGYYINGVGSSWELMTGGARHFGLKVKQLNKNNPQAIVNELRQGHPIIVSMGRGNFTRGGHIMVLRGVKNGKIIISDPYSRQKSEQLWDLSLIISQSSKKSSSPFWAYSK